MNLLNEVSIIIPAHNEENHIGDLLESMQAFNISLDIVTVVDVCSTDGTSQIAREYGANVVTANSKLPLSEARNYGAKNTNGKYLIFLDADVIITGSWVEYIRSTQISENEIWGETYHLSIEPSWIEIVWFAEILKIKQSYINGDNIIISRAAFERLKGFNEYLETGEDVDFCIRATNSGIDVKLISALKVHHEGNPQTAKSFINRERWHGKGDMVSLSTFFKSKVAMAPVLFILLHIVFVISLSSIEFSLMALGGIVLFCILIVVQKFRPSIKSMPKLAFVCYL